MAVKFQVYNDGGDLVATVQRGKLQAAVTKAVDQNVTKYGGLGRVCLVIFADGKYKCDYTLRRFELLPALRVPSVHSAAARLTAVALDTTE
jgi:hypothetical protein